ncbi:unnamed protein product [Polarella glacialis]|uniref:E3 ubiquitin-protein ligase CHFR n=1 Tax=Polarella glacialis TaxID=89957 RepID=A0A813LBZ3_POLGL|nr:unnamed protein product [Polarella glacialis]
MDCDEYDAPTLVLGGGPADDVQSDGLLDLLGDGSTSASSSATPGPPPCNPPVPPPSSSAALAAPTGGVPSLPPSAPYKRAATQTLEMDLGEEPLLGGPLLEADEQAAVLVSTNPSTAADVVLGQGSVTVGRDEACNAVLTDPRVSGEQFQVLRRPTAGEDGPPWTYELEDRSRNGTLINKKLLKAAKKELRDQDLIEVLPAAKVGPAAAITFLFHGPPTAEASGGPPAAKRSRMTGESSQGDALLDADQLFEGALCVICQEVLHHATSVQPCLHSFCSSCLGIWLRRPGGLPKCPACRNQVAGVARNHTLAGLIEGLLKAHPSRRRSDATLSDLDGNDPLKTAGYDLAKLRGGPGGLAAAAGLAAVAAGFAGSSPSDSENPESSGEEEEEDAGLGRPCFHCVGPAWRTLGAAAEASASSVFAATQLAKASLANNAFEQGVLQEWLRDRNLSLAVELSRSVADPNPEGVQAVRVRLATPGAAPPADDTAMPAGAWAELAVCRACAEGVLRALVYSLRERISEAELPARAQGRSNCWYGPGCRTQSHRPEHAARLNHVCQQTRFS